MNEYKEKRDIYPLELIKTSLYTVRFLKQRRVDTQLHEPLRTLIVYAIQKVDDAWLPLNRDYKPIGLHGYHEWADYEKYPFLLIPEYKIHFDELKIQPYNIGRTEAFNFFNDSTYPDKTASVKRYIDIVKKTFFHGKEVIP